MKLTTWLNTVATVISSTNLTSGVCHKLQTSRGNYSLSIIRGAGTDANSFRISVAAINTDGEVDVDTVSDADYPSVSRSYIKLEMLYCMQGVGHELTGREIDFMEDMYNKLYT